MTVECLRKTNRVLIDHCSDYLFDNTERPETIEVGSNVLAGTGPERILETAKLMVKRQKGWVNPFGDGKTAERIVEVLIEKLQ